MAKKTNKKQQQKRTTKKSIKWGKWIKNIGIATAFIAVVGVAFAFKSKISEEEQDISVIGNGLPTVVQMHDPNCQFCRRLKSNLDSVKGEFKDKIQFKIVNIKTAKGRAFANQHNVSHVTLLFFDKKGKRTNTLEGVTPKEEIKTALAALERRR